ncbi:hypothetical protein QR680_014285 [Steinernema hermaphroditum]|uniref:Uncharacterized protein n=1 Tax=Steinernema hermaphroditum TaxID=289476 RepID=A0AA39M2Y1_9BILA|nr:hypothetical protein QR680_014285 [Steinernema hermaphroditum]
MDSVPYAFCEAVMATVRYKWGQCQDAADHLPEPWCSVARKQKMPTITVLEENGEWMCGTVLMDEVNSLEEVFQIDRRFVKFDCIYVGSRLNSNDNKIVCSKEDVVQRVVPFLRRQTRPTCSLFFERNTQKEKNLMYLDLFRNFFVIGELVIPYVGTESRDFLASQIKDNPALYEVLLFEEWPHSYEAEQLLVDFLDSPDRRSLIMWPKNRDSALRFNKRILKAAFDSWLSGDNRRALSVCVGLNVSRDDVLGLPFPENVTRTEEVRESEYDKRSLIIWQKEDGSCLTLEFTDHSILIDTNPALFKLRERSESESWDSDDSMC